MKLHLLQDTNCPQIIDFTICLWTDYTVLLELLKIMGSLPDDVSENPVT